MNRPGPAPPHGPPATHPAADIAVVIPNWNGLPWLPGCLAALASQSWPGFEIVVVDNASTDGSTEWLERQAPHVRRIRRRVNTGFAAAVNTGIRATQTPLIALLNTDTRVAPDWIEQLGRSLLASGRDTGAVCGKLLQFASPGRIENAGDTLNWWGLAEKRGHGRPETDFEVPGEVFSCCAGAALYRRALFDAVGLFDTAFFAYLEDIDLGLRSRLRGWRFRYVPQARALHHGHGSHMPTAHYVRRSTANRLRVLYKNLPAALLRRHAVALLAGQCWVALCRRHPVATLAGYLDFVRDRAALRAARRENLDAIRLARPEIDRLLHPRHARFLSGPTEPELCLHLATPPPRWAGTDAVAQDVQRLSRIFRARVIHVYPGHTPRRWIPALMFGWARFRQLREADRRGCIHHVFAPGPRAFPYLRGLKGPLLYTVTADAAAHGRPPAWLRRRAQWIVTHARDAPTVQAWSGARVHPIPPGVDLSQVRRPPLPPPEPFTLLMASAPWTRAQFHTKGVDLLLTLVRETPGLRLILLWRGLHTQRLHRRIRRGGIASRILVIDRVTDINDVLAQAHVVVLPVRDARLVKAWPHSLLEGLAAGRPALVTRAIPLSDEIQRRRWGVVMDDFSQPSLQQALHQLRARRNEWDPERLADDVRRLTDIARHDALLGELYAAIRRRET